MPTARPSDRELMRRVQADDAAAFALLYDRLAPSALRLAGRVVLGDPHRAQDAVQEGFLAVWRSRAQYCNERGEVRSWALGIIRNRAIDSWRRQRARPAGESERGLEELPARDDVEARVLAGQAAGELRDAVALLPAEQAQVVALAYFGELSQSEIALHLAIPAGTVKGRMRLGLARLREHLGEPQPAAAS
jgi:RNA polymerase sigma-70 factor, ECF subfamily